jgi:hypothetical protein
MPHPVQKTELRLVSLSFKPSVLYPVFTLVGFPCLRAYVIIQKTQTHTFQGLGGMPLLSAIKPVFTVSACSL